MDKSLIDYPRIWRTLLRLGYKNRFSDLRRDFFMKIAVDGISEFEGVTSAQTIIDRSYVFYVCPELKQFLNIQDNKKFKHHVFKTEDNGINIEYFSLVDRENLDNIPNVVDSNLSIHGTIRAFSMCESFVPTNISDNKELYDEEPHSNLASIILVAEKNLIDKPIFYSSAIKHELGRICLYEIKNIMGENGYGFDDMKTPLIWSDEQLAEWVNDIRYLYEFFLMDSFESKVFEEFIVDFIGFESDGQTREANPIVESRIPKTTNPNGKPRVTYRTLTPMDRFSDWLDILHDNPLKNEYGKILESFRNFYTDYDGFLESIKMN